MGTALESPFVHATAIMAIASMQVSAGCLYRGRFPRTLRLHRVPLQCVSTPERAFLLFATEPACEARARPRTGGLGTGEVRGSRPATARRWWSAAKPTTDRRVSSCFPRGLHVVLPTPGNTPRLLVGFRTVTFWNPRRPRLCPPTWQLAPVGGHREPDTDVGNACRSSAFALSRFIRATMEKSRSNRSE